MKLYLSTPVLRQLVRKLNTLDKKLADTIVNVDDQISRSKLFGNLLGNEIANDIRQIQPFLHKELIKETIKECVAKEELRRSLPSVGNLDPQQDPRRVCCSLELEAYLYLDVVKGKTKKDEISTKV